EPYLDEIGPRCCAIRRVLVVALHDVLLREIDVSQLGEVVADVVQVALQLAMVDVDFVTRHGRHSGSGSRDPRPGYSVSPGGGGRGGWGPVAAPVSGRRLLTSPACWRRPSPPLRRSGRSRWPSAPGPRPCPRS